MREFSVHVWSDIACPWCYVGKRRLESALAQFEHADAVQIVWRSFELDPSAPRVRPAGVSYAQRLANKYGTSLAQAEGMLSSMVEVAAHEGLSFRFDILQGGNTFDAHRVLHLALARGLQGAVKERFFRGYFCEGEAIGEHETLVRLGSQAGLDPDEVAAVLSSDAHAAEVRADQAEARQHGISGVPFYIIGQYGVSGAQPPETLVRVLESAWKKGEPEQEATEGQACGVDGCT